MKYHERTDEWELNRADMKNYYDRFTNVHVGYCCYQDDGKGKFALDKLGYNCGVYGWNWSLYADYETDTLYISFYRNVPSYIEPKGTGKGASD